MLFIEYPKCSTCQKAKKFLDSKNKEYLDRNIVIEKPSKKELDKWIKLSGKDISKFFNTSGLLYKELNLKDKLDAMDDNAKLALLSQNGMLVKRPLIIKDNTILVGFKEEEWKKHLLN